MTKFRIYEIAKEMNVDSKEIVFFLKQRNIAVKSNLSSVDEGVRQMVLKGLRKASSAPAAKVPTAGSHAPAKGKTSVVPEKKAPSVSHNPVHSAQTVKSAERPAARPVEKKLQIEKKPPAENPLQADKKPLVGKPSQADKNPQMERRPQQQMNRPGHVSHFSHNDHQGDTRFNNNGRNDTSRNVSNRFEQRPSYASGNNNRSGDRPQQNRSNNASGGYRNNFHHNDNNHRNGQGGNFNKKNQNNRNNHMLSGTGFNMNSTHAGKEMGKRSQNFNKKEKREKIKGSYASRETRPLRSADHMMKPHKHKNNPAPKKPVEVVRPTSIEVGESISVKEFAKLLCRDVNEVIKKLFLLGKMVTINQEIDHETAELVGMDFNCEIKEPPPVADPTELPEVEDDPAKRLPRPPVVTVMGHVDHGKTSLLDAIRKTNVTAREAGGITQHIGAYRVICQGRPIVFLDTPGHEAFTAMRARGAQVTDIAVLVVAADDGVMPQTIEAINHARAAKVPIIVAINKIDKEGANPEFVMQQLSEHGLIPEAWGGDTIMVPVSARQKTGISDLLEMILLEADMLELKANPNLPAHGTIIEAKLDKGRGPVATVLIDRGTLHIGDSILAGTTYGKVRAMVNDRGEKVKKAPPSTPVEVLGLNDVPEAGDFLDATDEHTARVIAEKRLAKLKIDEQKKAKVSLDDIFNRIQEGEMKDLNIVVKADVQGTIQALEQALTNIKNTEVKVVIVHSGVGTINESDVMLASASNALIIGFNVRPDANARKAAETEKVDIHTYRVIYDALNDVEAAIKGMLAPKYKEKVIGHVEVRKVIPINKNLIAGAYVKDGKITRNAKIRLIRDGVVVHEGELDSLRRFKDDVKEVASGFECGLTLTDYRDIKEGDQMEVYVMEEVADE
jgi:translation initiation factor IF-2